MKNFSKFIVIILVLVIGQTSVLSKDYIDLSHEHWAYKQIQKLSESGILAGYPDGTFHPDEQVTRAEFATMVINAFNLSNLVVEKEVEFSDIDKNYWAWDNIQRAVSLDLIKGHPDKTFLPYASISKAQAYSVVMNSLSQEPISVEKAKEVLSKRFDDYNAIPEWVIVNIGKAEILGMIVYMPNYDKKFNAETNATRAELSVLLLNMLEQAKLNPNDKLRAAMQPPTADGLVIQEATLQGFIATIPAGTILPVKMQNNLSSQRNAAGEIFLAKTPQNFMTKDYFLLLPESTPIVGQILEAKSGIYFIREGKLILATRTLKTLKNNKDFGFEGINLEDVQKLGFWQNLGKIILKGGKINIDDDEIVDIRLVKPLKIDLTNGMILDNK